MEENFDNVVLLVGAGAVENAWQPVIHVMQQEYNIEFDVDCANSMFARLVYLTRFMHTEHPDQFERFIGDVNKIKNEICRHLAIAQQANFIKPRKELQDILDKFVFVKNHKIAVLSTNWDTVIDNAMNTFGHSNQPGSGKNINTYHLHGSILSPKGLYLPSEIARESYRNTQEDSQMKTIHTTAAQTIAKCNKLILYGLSLDPLDAELCQTMASVDYASNIKEIIIINPDHKRVAKRVKLLMDSQDKVEINGYSPEDLDTKIKY
jgi:hypothetical protein